MPFLRTGHVEEDGRSSFRVRAQESQNSAAAVVLLKTSSLLWLIILRTIFKTLTISSPRTAALVCRVSQPEILLRILTIFPDVMTNKKLKTNL